MNIVLQWNHAMAAKICCLLIALGSTQIAFGVRIKDIVEIKGVRNNTLNGLGLLVGLPGTGDSNASEATKRALASMHTRLGHPLTNEQVVPGSTALVSISAELPTFSQNGDRLDGKIAVIGDASSLVGGTLMMTPLYGPDGKVYAVAQGTVQVATSGTAQVVLTTGTLPSGVTVEKEFRPDLQPQGMITLSLRMADFTTSTRTADAINRHLRGFFAKALDPSRIQVQVPSAYGDDLVGFIAEIEQIDVSVDRRALVVVNPRSGTVVMGNELVIEPVAVSHGQFAINIGKADLQLQEGKQIASKPGVSVGELAQILTAFGITPSDFISILESLNAAGALQADIKYL